MKARVLGEIDNYLMDQGFEPNKKLDDIWIRRRNPLFYDYVGVQTIIRRLPAPVFIEVIVHFGFHLVPFEKLLSKAGVRRYKSKQPSLSTQLFTLIHEKRKRRGPLKTWLLWDINFSEKDLKNLIENIGEHGMSFLNGVDDLSALKDRAEKYGGFRRPLKAVCFELLGDRHEAVRLLNEEMNALKHQAQGKSRKVTESNEYKAAIIILSAIEAGELEKYK